MKRNKTALLILLCVLITPSVLAVNGETRAMVKDFAKQVAIRVKQALVKAPKPPIVPIIRPPYSVAHSFRNDVNGVYNALKTTGLAVAYVLSKGGPNHAGYQKLTTLLKKYAPWWVGGSLAAGYLFCLYKSFYGTPAPPDASQYEFNHYREDYLAITATLATAVAAAYLIYKPIQYLAFVTKYKKRIAAQKL